jgi:hypothetical protein
VVVLFENRSLDNDPQAALPPGRVVGVLRDIAGHFFPLLARDCARPPMSPGLLA